MKQKDPALKAIIYQQKFVGLAFRPGLSKNNLALLRNMPSWHFSCKKYFLLLWLIDSVGWLWQEVYIGQTDPNEPNSGAPPPSGHSGPRKQLKFSTRYFTKLCFSQGVFKRDRESATIQNLCKYLVFQSTLRKCKCWLLLNVMFQKICRCAPVWIIKHALLP